MMHITLLVRVRFQPYSMAVQTRFKWRHKETDRWRRLMDASCFPVDWLGQTRGPTFSQFSGHWSHLLTCAHVICPWDYPNYYPPQGPTRFVSHITLADTMTQVRTTSLQGNAVYKHFVSNQHVFVHSNPRLDLCVIHPEQNLKRSGEMKMMWMQNEGYVIRPRLELTKKLEVGDHVWIYGMTAHESLFDEEKAPEPLMIPTGVRARVAAVTREHFFLDTTSIEGEHKGTIQMGMCGSPVMREGKCVGMLTATVHKESTCTELAGTAMCTHATDIFEFLLEVEKQMKNPIARQQQEETRFEARRAEEGKPIKEHKDWELDQSRIARHIPVPASLWHMEESWMTEEDHMTGMVFGRSGPFNQETQESTLGYDMNSAKTNGERPGDMPGFGTSTQDGKAPVQGQRKDYSPTGVYAPHESFKTKDVWDYDISADMRSLFDHSADDKDAASINMLRKSLENIRAQRAMEKAKETAMNAGKGRDPLNMGAAAGHYAEGGSPRDWAEHFGQDGDETEFSGRGTTEEPRHSRSPPAGRAETPLEQKKRERREAEAKYQAELRRRHGHKAAPFGDEDLTGMWEHH